MLAYNIMGRNSSLIAFIALTAISGGLFLWLRTTLKRKYERVATVAKLIIYPIKSLHGIQVEQVEVTKLGIKYGLFRDRSWLLVDNENRFITQRVEPSLALIRPSLHDNELWLEAPDMPILKLSPRQHAVNADDIVIETKVWGSPIKGVYCGQEAEQWFSNYLNKPGTKLIENVPGLELRNSRAERNGKIIDDTKHKLIFHDGSGLHLINQSSIDDLNGKLSEHFKVSHRNFRPNVVVTDCLPYEEDKWSHIMINEIQFAFLKPCERCVLTTINPDTGIKTESEPLETLRRYRLAPDHLRKIYGTSPLFGISIAPENEGLIRCGNDVLAAK